MSSQPMKIQWPIGLTRDMPGRTNRSDVFDRTLNDYARAVMGPNRGHDRLDETHHGNDVVGLSRDHQ